MVVEIRFIQMLHYCMVDKELTMMVIDRATSMYCISTRARSAEKARGLGARSRFADSLLIINPLRDCGQWDDSVDSRRKIGDREDVGYCKSSVADHIYIYIPRKE